MTTRRLRWHGAARQKALFEHLQRELSAWLDGWSVDPDLLSLSIAPAEPFPVANWRWIRAQSRNGALALGASAAQLDALGGRLAGAATSDPLQLGRRVGERALRAMLTQFAGGSSAGPVEFIGNDAPFPAEADPRYGGCVFALRANDFDARLLVDNGLFEQWVPPRPHGLPALVPRDAVLGPQCVTLDVVLDLGSASLADTGHLQVGDVLVSNAAIDTPFHISLPDSRRLIAAHLVRQGPQRALCIEATSVRKPS